MPNFDVIVVGGGPAGATAALESSRLGFKTALIEKGKPDRHKPCGGVLPDICTDILDDLGLKIPADAMCSPPRIGLFYVPPSGRNNGGYVRNYRLLNLNRDRFDSWLRGAAESSGATILYQTEFVRFKKEAEIKVLARVQGNTTDMSTRYLIGADGTFSTVRRQLYPNTQMDYLPILQEHWSAEGDFGEYFYTLFNGNVTSAYSYVIPKNENFIVGTGAPSKNQLQASECITRFKDWLRREFHFNPIKLEKREASAIPYSSPLFGQGNVILIGDAGGFCNHLSGEGVRLAIESSVSSCEAIADAESEQRSLSSSYVSRVGPLADFVQRTHEFAIGMTDDSREEFVRSELSRKSLEPLRTQNH